MKIGEKIAKLRNAKGISQEELADELGVSSKTVLKWEMNQSLPQVEEVVKMCGYELFCPSKLDWK